MTKIALWQGFVRMADELRRQLPAGDELVVPKDETQAAMARDVEVVIGSNRAARVRAILDAAPGIRWYHSVGAGVDEMPLDELERRAIAVTNNSGSYDIQIAEHVIAMVLAAAKCLHRYRDQQARAEWREWRQAEVRDATMVVHGLGSIGAETARLASGLGMRVIGVRRRDALTAPGVERIVGPDRLAEVAAAADYLVIATPLTDATRGSVSAAVIAAMKPTAWIVNIARGQIIDTNALIDALREERIGGAALDAFDDEPLPATSPLWSLENVIITPHSSNSSPRLQERTLALFLENLRRYKAGEPLLNRVDRTAGY